MELDDLLRLQREFDSRHGWLPSPDDPSEIFGAVQSDLIGIFGEIGELANIVKKVALEIGHDKDADIAGFLEKHHEDLAEELIDSLIYLVRLAGHLNVNIEKHYINKLGKNEQRFKRFENS
jgi:NTP pyrophosphatase (non-canonical NTP hydrolase)